MASQFSAYHMVLTMALNESLTRFEELEKLRSTGRIGEPDREVQYGSSLHPFVAKYQAASASTVLLAAATVEAYANFIITLKTDPQTFEMLERTKLIEKWAQVIPLLEPSYSIDRGGQLFEDLTVLVRRRNQILHPKPQVELESGVVHKGNPPAGLSDEPGFVRKSASLPSRLLESLCQIDSEEARTLLVCSGLPYDQIKRIQESTDDSAGK